MIPHVPVRQWVLALPIPLRLLLASQPKLVTPVLQVVHRVITRFLLAQAGLKAEQADSGAVTLIQRFGSTANLNIPLHCLVLDGVYRRVAGEAVFVEVPAPTDEALQAVLYKIIARLMKMLTRRGVLVKEQGATYLAHGDADSDDARALRPLHAAAWPCRPRRASGPAPRQAQPVHRTVCVRARPIELPSDRAQDRRCSRCKAPCRETPRSPRRCVPASRVSAFTPPCAAMPTSASGSSNCAATSRARRRTEERVQINRAGQVVLRLKTAWRDDTTHLVMSPASANQLGSAAQARVSDRPGALPELRWSAQDHRGHPRSTGDREDPHAPGVAGPGATPGASAWRLSTRRMMAARGTGLRSEAYSPTDRLGAGGPFPAGRESAV